MDMQVVRMEMLLKDLLWLSRIESIEHSDKTTSVDMCDLTVELVEDLRLRGLTDQLRYGMNLMD